MKTSPKCLLVLAFTLAVGCRAQAQEVGHGQLDARFSKPAAASPSAPVSLGSLASENPRAVTRYITGSDGDHSLDAAIVVEQVFAQYSLYTVRLQFASGAEQSISVTAPSGGLQPELRDMSGDSVPNDVVLSSKVLRLPLVVLLNEGHDHLTVASSPGSFSPDDGRTSGTHQVRHASALVSPGFKSTGLASGSGLFLPQLRENLISPIARRSSRHSNYSSSSGRAPPCS
jgi:hypothetical protein